MTSAQLLSAVVPVYNEEPHLDAVVARLDEVLRALPMDHELIFVDDGSADASWARLRSLADRYPRLRALRLSRNFGKEAAVAAGLNAARGDLVVVLDGDLQHPPELIHEMVAIWARGDVDLVEAVKQRRGDESWWARLGARLFYRLNHKLGSADLDGATDFKLMDRRVIDAWRQMGERNIFFRGMSAWLGFRRATVAFAVPARVGGGSRWRFLQLLQLAVTGITAFSSAPLQLTTWIGMAFLGFSLLLGLHTLYMKLTGQAVSGFATVILLLLLVGSCILISLGIIGIYLARIYEEVKGRPRYVVLDRLDGEKERAND